MATDSLGHTPVSASPVKGSATSSANVFTFPTAAGAPICNPKRRGRLPKAIATLSAVRYARRAAKRQAEASAPVAAWCPISDAMVCIPRGGFEQGAAVLDDEGNRLIVTRPYGPVRVGPRGSAESVMRYGYVCANADNQSEVRFYPAHLLRDGDRAITHLRLISSK